MKQRLKDWFEQLVCKYVILDIKPTAVHFDTDAVAKSLAIVMSQSIVAASRAASESALKHHSDAMRQVITHAIGGIPKPDAPVVNIPQPIAVVDADVLAAQLNSRIEGTAREMIAEALKPPPKTLDEMTLLDPPPNPSAEAALLSNMPTDIQYAVRYSCRKVQNEHPSPAQGTTLGNNWHRNEACEWAKTWLRERGIKAKDTDINLATELYYRVYIRPGKVQQ